MAMERGTGSGVSKRTRPSRQGEAANRNANNRRSVDRPSLQRPRRRCPPTSMRRRRCDAVLPASKLVRLLGQHAQTVTANGPFDGIDVGDERSPPRSEISTATARSDRVRRSIFKLRSHVLCRSQATWTSSWEMT